MISAKVIKHSRFLDEELITVEIELHRFILPEFNTHRRLSRNFQSSRAVPVKKMIKQVRDDPAMPVHWGKNQKGMVAEKQLEGEELDVATKGWMDSAKSAADRAEELSSLGVHKQLVNRLLEAFMWTKGIVTATRSGWDSFFALRVHPDAQPEIQTLANKIRDAIEVGILCGEVQELREYEWHLPYVDISDFDSLEDAIKVSTSCCAQVSYRRLDVSLEKAISIYEMLNLPSGGVFSSKPPHMSPCEHQALAVDCRGNSDSPSDVGGNFQTMLFYQYRKMLEQGVEKEFNR
jgi:hypothetical protein